jgi:hypothetical protein
MEDFSEPSNPLEVAADLALRMFDAEVIRLGGQPRTAVIFAWTDGLEPNAVSGCSSIEEGMAEPEQMFAFLVAQAMELGQAIGVTLKMAKFGNG